MAHFGKKIDGRDLARYTIRCKKCGLLLRARPGQYKRRCYACGSITYTSEERYQEEFWKKVGPYEVLTRESDRLEYQGELPKGLIVASVLFTPLLALSIVFVKFIIFAVILIIFYLIAIYFILRTRSYVIDKERQQAVLITKFHGLIAPKIRTIPFTQIKEIVKSDDRDIGGESVAPSFYIEFLLDHGERVNVYTSEDWGRNGRDAMFDLIYQYIYGTRKVDP